MILEENDLVRSYLTTLVQILSYSSHVNTEGEPSIVSIAFYFISFSFVSHFIWTMQQSIVTVNY